MNSVIGTVAAVVAALTGIWLAYREWQHRQSERDAEELYRRAYAKADPGTQHIRIQLRAKTCRERRAAEKLVYQRMAMTGEEEGCYIIFIDRGDKIVRPHATLD